MQTNFTSDSKNPARNSGIVAALLLLGGTVLILPFGKLHAYGTVPWFLLGASVMLAGFHSAIAFSRVGAGLFWAVAISARLILLFQIPGDDIYRYVWEGDVVVSGWNPYLHPPESETLAFLRNDIWEKVQHKSVTAIYPPLVQVLFAVMALLRFGVMEFKLVFLLADLAVVLLLTRRFGVERTLLYAWNPLVIYCFAGGGHYDSLFLFALVAGWLAFLRGRRLSAAGWLGVAVALKWLALPLIAWLGWRTLCEAFSARQQDGQYREWRRPLLVALVSAAPLLLSYLLLSWHTGEWTTQLQPGRFSLTARSAEFIPGIVEWFQRSDEIRNGWILIPLAAVWAVTILRGRSLERTSEWLFFFAYILTPMLHAWYFTWVLPFAVRTRNLGAVAVTGSAFLYFLLYHHIESPGGQWRLFPMETSALWLPYIAGFLWSAWIVLRKPPAQQICTHS